jgi:acetamidase/formamidase
MSCRGCVHRTNRQDLSWNCRLGRCWVVSVLPVPAGGLVATSGPSGNYGGNMDYNDTVGRDVLLPVFASGAAVHR